MRGRSRRVRVEAVADGNCERRLQLGSVKKRRYRFYLLFLEPVKVEATILVDLELLTELLKVLGPLTLKCQDKECDNTMEELHRFRVVAWWASGRTGIAKSSSAPNAIHFTSPPAFGGLEGRWTPEDLLLCAAASCYTTTFQTLAEYSKFEYTDLQVEVEGDIKKADVGYNFSEIVIHANLTISEADEQARALKLLHKTEGLCLVSRALSVKQRFEPHVLVGKAREENSHALPVSGQVSGKEEGYR